MGVLEVYYHIMSQPSRTVVTFLEKNEIKFNRNVIDMKNGQHKSPEYLKINNFGVVPAAVDDDWKILQSSAIVKYAFSKYKVADHWYPADLKQRARVDEILDWYPSNIRQHGSKAFYILVGPHLGLGQLTEEEIENRYKELEGSLTILEDVYLKDQKFLCGDKITIADLFCANEMLQPTFGERDVLETHPRLKAWMERVREDMNPVWDRAVAECRAFLKDLIKN